MAWLRIDDGEALDSRIGALEHDLYRARHALMQLCAREYRDDGIFPRDAIVHAAYATPKGPRALTRRGLQRLVELDLVRAVDNYSDDDLHALDLDEFVGKSNENLFRIHHWERYNPPRDKTATERKRREREAKKTPDASQSSENVTEESRRDVPVTSRPGHGPSRAGTRAQFPSRPVTTDPSDTQSAAGPEALEQSSTRGNAAGASANGTNLEPSDSAAAAKPSDAQITDACRTHGADRDIVFPLADQLDAQTFATVVQRVADTANAGKVRGTPAALLVEILQRTIATSRRDQQLETAERIAQAQPAPEPVERATLEQAIAQNARQLAHNGRPWPVVQAVLTDILQARKAQATPELIAIGKQAYDDAGQPDEGT